MSGSRTRMGPRRPQLPGLRSQRTKRSSVPGYSSLQGGWGVAAEVCHNLVGAPDILTMMQPLSYMARAHSMIRARVHISLWADTYSRSPPLLTKCPASSVFFAVCLLRFLVEAIGGRLPRPPVDTGRRNVGATAHSKWLQQPNDIYSVHRTGRIR